MATVNQWAAGARPRTLPMAVSPVVIGAAAGLSLSGGFDELGPRGWLIAVLALVVALALQVGVNYANDYSDGVRGTDDVRVGPMRLTATGAAAASQVKAAAFISFGLAGLAGLGIVLLSGLWWMLAVGVVCVLAAWWYTGGRHPYGYLGLGEVMVFIFFGLVATLGTTYAMVEEVSAAAVIGAVSHGLIASALLMANNIRDIPTDREAGKKTLAVRLGQRPARWWYCAMVMIALAIPLALSLTGYGTWYWLVLLCWPAAAAPLVTMWPWRRALPKGTELIPVLQQSSVVGLAFAATFSAAMLLS